MKKNYLKPNLRIKQLSTDSTILAGSDPGKNQADGDSNHYSKGADIDFDFTDTKSVWGD